MKNRKRIHKKGLYAGSTSDYGSIVDSHEPIGLLHNPLEMLDKIPIVKMTRKEFESKNMFSKLLGDIDDYFPDASLSKRSKIYKAIRNEIYRLLYINRKALEIQGSSLEVA